MGLWDSIERFLVWSNREPWLTVRRVLWVVTFGWVLFLAYVFAGITLLTTIIFAPFALQAFKFAWFALDPITKEPYHEMLTTDIHSSPWNNPAHPFSVVANVVWLLLFGWALACLHLAAAVVQALTIIGLATALVNLELAVFVLWPFGRGVRERFLPTTVEELHNRQAQREENGTIPLV